MPKNKSQKVKILESILLLASVLTGFFLHSASPLYNWLTIILLFSIAVYFYKRNFSLFGPSVFFILIYLTGMLPLAKLGLFFIIPLVLYLGLITIFRRLKESTHWLKAGILDRTIWLFGLVIVAVSSLALYLWARIMKPDLSDLLRLVPDANLGILLLLGLAFAVINSIVEESIYRGILWDALGKLFGSLYIIIPLQALIFSLAHIQGFPRGAVGIFLALIYGILLGVVRVRARGLLAPILIHIVADTTIFIILLGMLGKI